jgi:hypothetical protein
LEIEIEIEIESKFKEGEVKKEGREKSQRYSTPILKKSFIIGIKLSVSRALRMVGWLGTSAAPRDSVFWVNGHRGGS